MADVEISVKDSLSPVIKAMALGMKDFRQPLRTAGLYLQKSIAQQFKARGKPRWKPLAKITVFYRRKFSDAPLLDTGRLMRSYVTRGGGSIYRLSNYDLTIGSNLDYAELHQYGGTSILHEKRWFKRKNKIDVQVTSPKLKNGVPAAGYKLKHVNKHKVIKVPARPLSIQPEDVDNIKIIFWRYIARKANGK